LGNFAALYDGLLAARARPETVVTTMRFCVLPNALGGNLARALLMPRRSSRSVYLELYLEHTSPER